MRAALRWIAENRAAHDRLLGGYDDQHPEIFNPIEQERLARSVHRAGAAITTATPPDSRVLLDVGAGTGNLTAHLLRSRGRVIASDLSEGMLAALAHRYAATPRLSTQALNGTDLRPLADASVDLVAAYSVLHHVPDYLTLVRDMGRVVRPGGVILLEHEKAPAYWERGPELARFFAEGVMRPPKRWTRLLKPETYWRRIRPLLIWQRWRDPRWMPEGDLHIWPDDHVEWDRIETVLRETGCEVLERDDHLGYEPRFDPATWERYRTRVADTRVLLARRAA